MEKQSNFKNLINNLTPSERVGIVSGIVIFIFVIILSVFLILANDRNNGGVDGSSEGDGINKIDGNENSNNNDGGENNGSGYVNPESTPIAGGDYNDIDTYLPHAVFVRDADYATMRYYADIYEDENPSVIYVEYSGCDAAARALADEYLNTIPTNLLSNYTIEYEAFSEDAYCTK